MKQHFIAVGKALIDRGLAFSLFCFFFVSSIFFQPFAPVSAAPILTERRGVWLTNVASSVLFTPGSVNRAIKQLAQLNFNTVYPVVWNRGYTFYPSLLAQEMTGKSQEPLLNLTSGGSDVLSAIVQESHHQGLEVIPWFEYGLMVPKNSPLVQRHQDWLTQSQEGNEGLGSSLEENLPNKASPKSLFNQWLKANHRRRVSQLVWLNPLHREVQQFIKGLILEVVMQYDVDGIQFDDHFGIPVGLGYDPLTIKLYQQEHKGKRPPTDPHNPEWMSWRGAKLTAFMADIVKTVKIVKPKVKISLSPNSHDFSYQNYLQDWKNWVKQGLVDELVLQVYQKDLGGFQRELMKPAVQFARQKIPVSVGILSGTLNSPVPIQQIEQQVKAVREKGFSGVSFFYWESLWGYFSPESPYERRQVFRTLFGS